MTAEPPSAFAYLGPAGTYHDEAARAFAKRLGIDDPQLIAVRGVRLRGPREMRIRRGGHGERA